VAVKTLLAEIKSPSKNPVASPVADSLDIVETAPTVAADGIDFVSQGNEIIIIRNSDVANPYTVTIKSQPDALGRSADVNAYSLGAGEYIALQLPLLGWADASTKKILITMNNAAIHVVLLRIAGLVN
jgi:hypothetical protein